MCSTSSSGRVGFALTEDRPRRFRSVAFLPWPVEEQKGGQRRERAEPIPNHVGSFFFTLLLFLSRCTFSGGFVRSEKKLFCFDFVACFCSVSLCLG